MDRASVRSKAGSNIGPGSGCESPAYDEKHERGSRQSGDSSPQTLRIVRVGPGRKGVDVVDDRIHHDDNDYRDDDTSK